MTLGVDSYREAFESIRASLPGERDAAFDAFAAKASRPTGSRRGNIRACARSRASAFGRPSPTWKLRCPSSATGRASFWSTASCARTSPPSPSVAGPDRTAGRRGGRAAGRAQRRHGGRRLCADHRRRMGRAHRDRPCDRSGRDRTGRPVAQPDRRRAGRRGACRRAACRARERRLFRQRRDRDRSGGGRQAAPYQAPGGRADAHHLWFMPARLGRDAALASTVFTFGARLSRNQIEADIMGEGAELSLKGPMPSPADSLPTTRAASSTARRPRPAVRFTRAP